MTADELTAALDSAQAARPSAEALFEAERRAVAADLARAVQKQLEEIRSARRSYLRELLAQLPVNRDPRTSPRLSFPVEPVVGTARGGPSAIDSAIQTLGSGLIEEAELARTLANALRELGAVPPPGPHPRTE